MPLDTLKEHFLWLGILQFDAQPHRMFIAKALNVICAAILAFYISMPFWFLIFDAVTFEDYSRSFFFFMCGSLCASWYTIYLVCHRKYAEIFDDLDDIVEKSKRIL